MTGGLSGVELIWIALALAAEGFAMLGFYKWKREDNERKRYKTNGPLEVFYRGKIRLYSFGMLAFFLCLVLGVEAALVPSPPTKPTPGLQMIVAKALFVDGPVIIIAVVALFALALVFDDRDRTLTDRAYDKKAEQRLLAIEAAAAAAALRADLTDAKADVAFTRADVAERRADVAAVKVESLSPRVDDAEGELDVHTEEITDHTDRLGTLEHRDGG